MLFHRIFFKQYRYNHLYHRSRLDRDKYYHLGFGYWLQCILLGVKGFLHIFGCNEEEQLRRLKNRMKIFMCFVFFLLIFKRLKMKYFDMGSENLPIARVSQASWKELHSRDSPNSAPSIKHASSPLLVKGQV